MNMNEINIQEYNLAYALLRGIGDRRQRIRAMVALYNDIHESTGGAGTGDDPPPLPPTRPSIFQRLLKFFTGAPPSLPTSDRTGAPVCLFGPGGDFTTEWPNRA